jgi:hypothetical protein
LTQLWDKQDQAELTHAAYDEIGGVAGALERRVETVYNRFSPEQREICRRIFLRLTQLGEGHEDTKRQAMLSELLPAGGEMTAVTEVIETLAGPEVRLITTGSEEQDEDLQVIEVAHEAIIRSWPRLKSWLDEGREAMRIQRRLNEAAWNRLFYRPAWMDENRNWPSKKPSDSASLSKPRPWPKRCLNGRKSRPGRPNGCAA